MENIHPAISACLRKCDITEMMIVITMIFTLQKYIVCLLWMEIPGYAEKPDGVRENS